jgi:hypothetical protein
MSPAKMTTISVFTKLLFGPNPGSDHIVKTSLEAPPLSEDFGEKFGRPMERGEGFRHDEDHAKHHYQHPVRAHLAHEKHSERHRAPGVGAPHDHHHRPHEKEIGASIRPMTPEEMKGAPDRHHGPAPQNFTKENADAVRATAHRLGISPKDLSTIIGYETIGSYSPSKQGLGGHVGLIQFGRAEQQKYGVHPGQTFPEQMQGVEQYLKDRGVKPGMGIRDVYSTVSAGAPGRYSARDIGGSVDEHVARMQRDRSAQAERFLASGRGEAQKRLLGGAAHLGPEAPGIEHASRKHLLGFRGAEGIPLSGAAAQHGADYSLGHMQPEFRARLAHIMAAAKAAGHPLSVSSGYRSQEHQNRLFGASNRSGHMVARHSHHTAGTAADLRGDLAWAHAHAAEFGLRFPMTWENWHVEPMRGDIASQKRPHAEIGAPKVYASTGPLPHTPAPPSKTTKEEQRAIPERNKDKFIRPGESPHDWYNRINPRPADPAIDRPRPRGFASTGPLPRTPAPPAQPRAKPGAEDSPIPGETIDQYLSRRRQKPVQKPSIPRPGWGYPKGTEREDV